MRGLAFPTDPTYREYSNDRETPLSIDDDGTDNIAIDPALAGPVIDPAILAQEAAGTIHGLTQHTLQPSTSQYRNQYSPGPQGDPFAPPPPPIFVPDSSNIRTPRPAKKKRKPRREEECGFCQGDDTKNQQGHSELMVSCVECGRSGHPTCMELGNVADIVRSYPWNCIECKKCEVCHEKGDDSRILFCDFCDRGWHMDCLQPPVEMAPEGKWHCPMCPPIEYFPQEEIQAPTPHMRANSVASTSYSHEPPTRKRKSTSKANLYSGDELDSPASRRGVRSRKSKGKGKVQLSDDDQEDVRRSIKRMRLKVTTPPPPRVVVRLRLPANRGKGKAREEEGNHQPKGIFEDILAPEDRDTTRTAIESWDKLRYEKSRTVAEVKLFPPNLPPRRIEPDLPISTTPSTRPLRSSHLHSHSTLQISTSNPGPSGSPAPSTPGGYPVKAFQSSSTPTLRIRTIRFGEFDIQTWYDAPFPEEYANLPDGRLWLCEFCLKYMRSQFLSVRHRTKCRMRHPPGDEIYRDGAVSVFEVDGRKNKIYCQNLCLLSKMFLDHKSLFYDVEPFLFYVITETDDIGARFVGYFSKEKRSPKDYNVSCIMTLPVRQRKGWGNLLIDFSYLLSKKEQRVGSPEKPLSALGALGYRNYWTLALMRYLDTAPSGIQLEDISTSTCMTIEDICATLTQQSMLTKRDATPQHGLIARPSPGQSIKFTRGRKNGVARRHLQRKQTSTPDHEEGSDVPFVKPEDYEIVWSKEIVRAYLDKWEAKGYLKLKPEKLKWSPFILFRARKTETVTVPATIDPNGAPVIPVLDIVTQLDGGMSNLDTLSAVAELVAAHQSVTPATATNPTARPTDEEEQMEQDRAFAVKLATTTSVSPITRLRSQDEHNENVPKLNGNSHPSPSNTRSHSRSSRATTRRSRSQSPQAPTGPTHSLEGDEALAAQLASEENSRTTRRQLRSRSGTALELKRTASNQSSQTPIRKRRRVDSSPVEPDNPVAQVIDLNDRSHIDVDRDVHSNGWLGSTKMNGMNGQVSHPPSPLKKQLVIDIDFEPVPKDEDMIADEMLEPVTPLTALTSRMSELGNEDVPLVDVEEGGDVSIAQDEVDLNDEDAEGELDDGDSEEEVDYT